jgi:hypothetical protein
MGHISEREALERIQTAHQLGMATYSRHRRVDKAYISPADQYHAVMNATKIVWKETDQNWEIAGPDRDGEPLTLIFDLTGNCVHTVTAFGGRENE